MSNATHVENMNILDYKAAVYYGIDCFNRGIYIAWDGDQRGKDIFAVVDDAYNRWCDDESNPELQDICCEEYIVGELAKLGFQFSYCYTGEEEE